MDNKFKILVNADSIIVDSIIAAMFHSKRNDARRFLLFMNDVIDYYLSRPIDDKVCYPIVSIPNAPDWAREVFLKFLILKLSLFYNDDKRKELKKRLENNTVYLRNEGDAKLYSNYERPFKNYLKDKISVMPNIFLGKSHHKNLIFCRENDIMVSPADKNRFISEFYGDIDNVCSKDNLSICHSLTAKDIRSQLKSSESDVNIDNIFVLYTNNEQCNSLNDSAFRLMKHKIKNCFIIDFSDKPLRLYKSRKDKLSFSHRFPKLPEKDALHYDHFITLSNEESHYIFNSRMEDCHFYLSDNQLFYNGMIGDILEQSEHPILDRIHLSLCLDKIQSDIFVNRMKEKFPNYPHEFYQISVDYQLGLAQKEILPRIKRFIANSRSIGIILPYDATEDERNMFKRILPKVKNITFYSLSDLKQKNKKNKIKEDKVINFVYRPHYANMAYHKYPNSFDSYITNKNQIIGEFINGFAFENMYLWDKYEYDRLLSNLLNSAYRKSQIGEMGMPSKPEVQRVSGETDFDDERTNSRTIKSYKITFEDGSKISIPETGLVIVQNESDRYICRMSELMEDVKTDLCLQKLDEIKYVLTEFMERKTLTADTNEKLVRKFCFDKGMITQEELDSEDYLWKILLAHKVHAFGAKKVHEEIMSRLNERDRIQLGAFKHWYTKNSIMMLPLQRVCQKRLIEYLGLQNTPYLSIMRNKKRATRNGTRHSNSMTDKFLIDLLFQDIDPDKFDEFYDSDINDILQIENISDLEVLISMIVESINLRKIKTIK